MPLDERVRRWESLHATVGAESPERWATTFLDRLQRAVGKRRGRRFVV
jgi:trehalose-6-phosphate synthase